MWMVVAARVVPKVLFQDLVDGVWVDSIVVVPQVVRSVVPTFSNLGWVAVRQLVR